MIKMKKTGDKFEKSVGECVKNPGYCRVKTRVFTLANPGLDRVETRVFLGVCNRLFTFSLDVFGFIVGDFKFISIKKVKL